jgi:hypothetical protein
VDRNAWVRPRLAWVAPSQVQASLWARGSDRLHAPARVRRVSSRHHRPGMPGSGLGYQQSLGGPDGFVLFQLAAVERLRWRLADSTWVQGTVQLGLVDDYGKFKYTAPSDLPRVRTYLRSTSRPRASRRRRRGFTHVGTPAPDQFYAVSGGLSCWSRCSPGWVGSGSVAAPGKPALVRRRRRTRCSSAASPAGLRPEGRTGS